MEINKLYNENCLETLAKMPDKFVDLVVTSPPYNMRTRIRNGEYTTREKREHFSKKYKHFGDDLSIDDFYSFHSEVLRELLRVAKIVCYNFQIVTGSKEAFFKIRLSDCLFTSFNSVSTTESPKFSKKLVSNAIDLLSPTGGNCAGSPTNMIFVFNRRKIPQALPSQMAPWPQ